jgi:hypothetical protein
MLIFKNRSYVTVEISLFFGLFDILENSVKLTDEKRWKIQWNILLFFNEWLRTLFLCGPE